MMGPLAGRAPPSRRSRLVLLAAAAVAFCCLAALGTWQVQRLHWKEALIRRAEERVAAAPAPLPDRASWDELAPEDIEFRRVVLDGRFLNDAETHVFIALTQPRGTYGGIGYFVVTPLVLGDGSIVLVNRGFVPEDRKDPATRPEVQVEGPVEIVGLMRPPDAGNFFTPAPNLADNIWFTRDPAEIAAARGLDPLAVAPFTVDAEAGAPGALPQGGETLLSFPNSHLQYAVTWYGLAAALVAVTFAFLNRR